MKNVERSERTRAALVAAGRRLFAERGYAATPTGDVVQAAGVTRGALYHHFADKRDLFRAVLLAVHEDLDARIGTAARREHARSGDVLAVFLAGADELLAASAEPDVARIVLIEGPMVLGASEWHAIDDSFNEGTLTLGVQQMMAAGRLPSQPVAPVVRLLVGMLNEAARAVAIADDRRAAHRRMSNAVATFITAAGSNRDQQEISNPPEKIANHS